MKKMIALWSCLLLCSCTQSIVSTTTNGGGGGGTDVGNGGNILVCGDGTREAFDIYEATTARKIALDLGDVTEPYVDKVRRILDRIPPEAGFREILQHNFGEFQLRTLIDTMDLRKIVDTDPDPKNIVNKPGCHLEQAIVQKASNVESYIYFIDQRQWDLLDSNSRAALVLHEIIYRYTISQGATDSRSARLLNAWVMAPQTEQRPCWLHVLLRDLKLDAGITNFSYAGATFYAKDTTWDNFCQVQQGNASPESSFVILGHQVFPNFILPNSKQRWNVTFNDIGNLREIYFRSPLELDYNNVHIKTGNSSYGPDYMVLIGEGPAADAPIELSVREGTFQADGKRVQKKGIFYFTRSSVTVEVSKNKYFIYNFNDKTNEYNLQKH